MVKTNFYRVGKAQRCSVVRQSRRETVYRMMQKKSGGKVMCFVCGKSVSKEDATLEHIKPVSKGGTDEMSNLSISHMQCNSKRGNQFQEAA